MQSFYIAESCCQPMSFSGRTERSTSGTEQQLHFSLGHLFTGWWSVIYFYWKARKALNLSFFYWSANVIRWTIWPAKWQLQEFETFRLAAFARYFFTGLFVPFIQIYFHIFLEGKIWIIVWILCCPNRIVPSFKFLRPPKKTSDDKKKKYSVAILLIDSLSQLSLIRWGWGWRKAFQAV